MSNLVNDCLQGKSLNTCNRKIGSRLRDNMLACGYMKKGPEDSDLEISLDYYGGLLLLSGEGSYTDGMGSHRLSPGTFVQRLPGHIHSTIVHPGEPWVEFFICINASTYQNLFDMGLLSGAAVLGGKVPKDIIDSFPGFLQRMKNAGESELLPLYFEAQSLLCRINACCAEEHITAGAVKECIRLLDYSFGRMTGREISLRIGISYESLRKKFYKAMGLSIGKYAVLTRISNAKEELLASKLSLAQIAEKLGYGDYFTFCKQFKQYVYMSPGEFREQRRRSLPPL